MKHLLLTFLTILCVQWGYSQTTYENFEGGAQLTWLGLDGTYNGILPNPDVTGVNTSSTVGSYTKSDMHAYSLLLADLGTPMDLSVNNEFHMKVFATTPSQILMKLEGTGPAIERLVNIAVVNTWVDYKFDFSAAQGQTGLSKIILFFDPGVETSGDTYLFDDVIAYPEGVCAGTIPDPAIIDDFECQRNASYGGGWDIIQVVNNPDASGINTSALVGEYTDPLDSWSALVVDYQNDIDLSHNLIFKAKVWSPKLGQMLFKLEGGSSPGKEVFVDITEINTWVEYKVDFSSQEGLSHKKLSIFFGAGVDALPGEIYYVDDIAREEKAVGISLDDFENGPSMDWQPLNGNEALHGTFNGDIPNPDATGANTTDNVGSYTKGSAAFSTLTAGLPIGFSFSEFPQINMAVWAPAGATSVRMQVISPIDGIKEVTRDISVTETWEVLNFDFSEFAAITDFEELRILFDPGVVSSDTYYFDELRLASSTVDPCEGIVVNPNIWDDFECQRNAVYGAGLDKLAVVANPDKGAGNPSNFVGEYTDPLDEWSALVIDNGGPIDLSVYNQFSFKVWSAKAVPVLVKLEGGTSPAKEVWGNITATEQWVIYSVDLSAFEAENHNKISIFFNGGVLAVVGDVYYIDDIQVKREPINGCVETFETPATVLPFKYFANGHLETEMYPFKVVANPNKSGINISNNVGEFVKASDALPFAGMFADLGTYLNFDNIRTLKAKVLMDHLGNLGLKVEGSLNGSPSKELSVANTTVNAWEEITIDFSEVPEDGQYSRIVVFFDLGIDATGVDVTSYFDDIVAGAGTCTTTGIFEQPELSTMNLFPNPVSDQLVIESELSLDRIEVYNFLGQLVRTIEGNNTVQNKLNTADWNSGMYIIKGYHNNVACAKGKVVRQ
ncbi:MAG: T9SS type A sorting domain-containing protein [Saprospiraceae bacterium]